MSPVDKNLQTQIDDNLRRIFEEDARADLPDTLLTLLSRLDEVEIPQPAATRGSGGTPADKDGATS
ncbi:NepR family anti-sigma factor [Tropicimonas aquimaris]|uniref:NepR family anti-sigma factor n=1 Tax=Tropicimonas aquimaris TaxID=914152 RepID=A0ABW3IWV9_9RHOB